MWVGDNAPLLYEISVTDIESGTAEMPFKEKPSWVAAQSRCPIHKELRKLISLYPSTKQELENLMMMLTMSNLCYARPTPVITV